MKNTILLLLSLCLIGLSSCYKETKKAPVYIDAEYKNNFSYKDGTYWIFYDSVSGNIDSLTTGGNRTFAPFEGTNRADDNLERIRMGMVLYNSANDSIITSWELQINAPFYLSIVTNISALLLSQNPIKAGYVDESYYCTFLNTYTDIGNTYNNVYKVKGQYSPYYDHAIYISKENGFITMQLTGNNIPTMSLHLLRHHINK